MFSIDLDASEEDRMKSSEELLKLGGSNPALVEKLFDAARYNVISATGIILLIFKVFGGLL